MSISEKKQLDPSHIIRSLSRSDVRPIVYLELCKVHPQGETINEISAVTKLDKRSVLGALLGSNGRYKTDDALVMINLAEMKEEVYHGQKIKIFTAGSTRDDVILLLRNYTRRNAFSDKLKKYVEQLEGMVSKKQ